MRVLNKGILRVSDDIQKMERRDFLKLGAVASACLAAGMVSSPMHAAMPDGINHMSESEYAIFHRLMTVLLPTEGSRLVSPHKLPVLQTVDGGFLAGMPPHVLNMVKGGVAYFNDAAKEPFGKVFLELSDQEGVAYCDALAASDQDPARGLFTALKFLVVTAYWAIPPAWGPTGFDGPVTEKWGVAYAGNAPLPEA
jgi:hypothetical protein